MEQTHRVAAIGPTLPLALLGFNVAGLAPALAQTADSPECPQERAIYKPWGDGGPGPRLVFYLDEEARSGPYPDFALIDESGNVAAHFIITVSTGAGKGYVLEADPPDEAADVEALSGDLGSILTIDIAPDTEPPKAAAWDGISVDGSPASQNIWIDQFANWDWYDYQHRPGSAGLIGAGSLWELEGCQPGAGAGP